MSRARRTAIVAAWLTTGCGGSWSQVAVAPTALDNEPMEVRATLGDGRRVELAIPRIERDTLFGEVNGKPVAIPMTDVRRLALPVASPSRRNAGTAAVVSALVVFAAAWVILLVPE